MNFAADFIVFAEAFKNDATVKFLRCTRIRTLQYFSYYRSSLYRIFPPLNVRTIFRREFTPHLSNHLKNRPVNLNSAVYRF